jgi:hypothetical protein
MSDAQTGRVVGFTATAEPWTEVETEDGTRLRLRLVVTEVRRQPDDANGRPQYGYSFQVIGAPAQASQEPVEFLRRLARETVS